MSTEDWTYTENLVEFCTALRQHGVSVSTDAVSTAAEALTEIDPVDREQFYYGLKVILIEDPSDEEVFDALFKQYWEDRQYEEVPDFATVIPEDVSEDGSDVEDKGEDDQVAIDPPDGAMASGETDRVGDDPGERSEQRNETGGNTDEDETRTEHLLQIGHQERSTNPTMPLEETDVDEAELSVFVKELGRQLGTLRGFQTRPESTGSLDLRRAMSFAREKGPEDLPRVQKKHSETKARFFVDVSHSMIQNMDRAFLLLFLFECTHQFPDVRVYFFDTTPTEVTRHFETADVAQTIAEMVRAQTEWGAGTTIGACLEEILTTDPFVVDDNAIAIVVSDGWDAGELDCLKTQMAELDRRCRSVLWFNPRAIDEQYEPKVSGMQTALPFVDHVFGFATVDDLREIVKALRSRTGEVGT